MGGTSGFPVVIFSHADSGSGAGLASDYTYLADHLASHGFVFVSTDGNHESDIVDAYQDLVASSVPVDTSRVVVGGHSQGGRAAFSVADDLATLVGQPLAAVLGLAPADDGATQLSATSTANVLIMYGSSDEDVKGRLVEPFTSTPSFKGTPFSLWDRAGRATESSGAFSPRNRIHKHFVYLDGGTHRGFQDWGLQPTLQNRVARTYVTAFLLWKANGQPSHASYFDDPSSEPDWLDDVDIHVMSRGARGPAGQPSRVIDNFDRPWGPHITSSGGGFATDGDIVHEFDGHTVLPSPWFGPGALYPSPHDTAVLGCAFADGPATPRVTWTMPHAQRDVAEYRVLSFRAGVVYLSQYNMVNGPPSARRFSVRVRDRNNGEVTVDTVSYTEISWPAEYYFHGTQIDPAEGDYTKSHMVGVRIPLADFATGSQPVDLQNLLDVTFIFDDGPFGHLQFDDLEFAF